MTARLSLTTSRVMTPTIAVRCRTRQLCSPSDFRPICPARSWVLRPCRRHRQDPLAPAVVPTGGMPTGTVAAYVAGSTRSGVRAGNLASLTCRWLHVQQRLRLRQRRRRRRRRPSPPPAVVPTGGLPAEVAAAYAARSTRSGVQVGNLALLTCRRPRAKDSRHPHHRWRRRRAPLAAHPPSLLSASVSRLTIVCAPTAAATAASALAVAVDRTLASILRCLLARPSSHPLTRR